MCVFQYTMCETPLSCDCSSKQTSEHKRKTNWYQQWYGFLNRFVSFWAWGASKTNFALLVVKTTKGIAILSFSVLDRLTSISTGQLLHIIFSLVDFICNFMSTKQSRKNYRICEIHVKTWHSFRQRQIGNAHPKQNKCCRFLCPHCPQREVFPAEHTPLVTPAHHTHNQSNVVMRVLFFHWTELQFSFPVG